MSTILKTIKASISKLFGTKSAKPGDIKHTTRGTKHILEERFPEIQKEWNLSEIEARDLITKGKIEKLSIETYQKWKAGIALLPENLQDGLAIYQMLDLSLSRTMRKYGIPVKEKRDWLFTEMNFQVERSHVTPNGEPHITSENIKATPYEFMLAGYAYVLHEMLDKNPVWFETNYTPKKDQNAVPIADNS